MNKLIFIFGRRSSVLIAMLLLTASLGFAQKTPSAEKIINDYLKTIGGKKRVAAVKDAVYEWSVKTSRAETEPMNGRARTRFQSPAAWRFDLVDAGENLENSATTTIATNGSSVWQRDENGKLQTLADAEANAIRLRAQLVATRLTDLKNQRVTARFVGVETIANEKVYQIEFAAPNGAKIFYYFGAASKLPLKIEIPALKSTSCFSEYKPINGVPEAHRIVQPCESKTPATDAYYSRVFELLRIDYNTNLKLVAFDPPRELENFDVAGFMKELRQNQAEIDRKVSEYTYRETRTERELDDKGAIKKETVRVYEIFPIAGRRVFKLISENGVTLSPERAEKEANRALEEIQDIERDQEKAVAKAAARQKNQNDEDDEKASQSSISSFLRASEIVSPRREDFRGRDAIVLDFRPREGYKPQNRAESIYAKLVGTAWIDPQDKRIMRMEMRFPEGFKAFGGLAKLKSGSAFVFEQTRIEDGVWLPRFSQINASVKAFFVAGFNVNQTSEYSNYRRANTSVKDYTVDSPPNVKPQL